MTTTVRIPTPLRKFTGGAEEVSVPGATVREALESLGESHGAMRANVFDEHGELRNFVNVFVGDTNVRSLDGLDSKVADGDVISIVPAVAGGAR